jgi:anaerobic sulfite reductase subunit B
MTVNPYRATPATILDIRQETAIDVTYRVAWDTSPQPGQFYEISLPRIGEAPISVSDFGDGYLEMTIRKVGHVTDRIFALRPGEQLFLRGPYGHGFPLEQFVGQHLVVAAGGTGLAPVKSVIRHFTTHREQVLGLDVVLGFRTPADILFRDEIAAWGQQANVQVTVDRAAEGWTGHVGVITTLFPALALCPLDAVQVIVVGPPMMMKFAVLAFLERGLRKEQIWVSYERRMSCGLGKCGHCKIGDKYVCLDGPVFNFSEAQWLID